MNTFKTVNYADAPSPIGAYSQGIMVENTLFGSGQIALDVASGQMKNSSIQQEVHQVMANIQSVLKSEFMNLSNIVKCSVFLTDMNDYTAFNDIYATYFDGYYPAREAVCVKTLPKNARVEISFVAVKPG